MAEFLLDWSSSPRRLLRALRLRRLPGGFVAPAATMRAFEARTLDNAELQRYASSHLGTGQASAPITTWDVRTLTLAAFYFSPELDLARAKTRHRVQRTL